VLPGFSPHGEDVYTYNFPNDGKRLKFLGNRTLSIRRALPVDGPSVVYGLFLLETVQSALALTDLYYWFASGFGNIGHLASPHFSVWNGPLLGGVASVTVQLFFAYHIWVLSLRQSWWLCPLISLVSRLYFNSGPDTASQMVSLSIVLHRRCRIRDFWGYLVNTFPDHVVSDLPHTFF